MGRENEWEKIYYPARKTLRALPEFAQENLNAAAQYTDLVTPGEVDSIDEIKSGEGAIIRRGLAKKDSARLFYQRIYLFIKMDCFIKAC
jgi:hypothetical protein